VNAFRISDYFIQALIDADILPDNTISVIIEARTGDIVKVHYSTNLIEEAKLNIVRDAIGEAHIEAIQVKRELLKRRRPGERNHDRAIHLPRSAVRDLRRRPI